MSIYEYIDNYNRIHKDGFTIYEIDDIINHYRILNLEKFTLCVQASKCYIIDGNIVFDFHDVRKSLELSLAEVVN